MPYVNGQYVAPSGGSGKGLPGLYAAPAKPKKKKKGREGDGGFLGTGIGPSITDIADETVRGLEGAGKDFIGLGSMVGQTASDFTWGIRHLASGDTAAARKDVGLDPTYDKHGNYVPRGIGTIGAAAVGTVSSLGGTAGDILDVTTPDIGPVDLGGLVRSGTNELIEGATRAATGDKGAQNPGGRWIVQPNGSRKWEAGDFGTGAQQAAEDFQARTYSERAKERGFLSPLIEDIGNVAIVGGALTKGAGLASAAKLGEMGDFHPLKFNPETLAADTARAESAGGAIAKVGRVGGELHHPLKNAWERTGAQLTEAADKATLAKARSTDPLVTEFYDSMGETPPEGTSFDPKQYEPDAGRSAKVAKAYDQIPEPGAPLTPEVKASYDALISREQQILEWMTKPVEEGGKGIKVDFVDAKDNPYMVDGKFNSEVSGQRMSEDVANGHLYVDKTGSFGESHPYLSNEQNDVLRAVHDYLGHQGGGGDFSSAGEDLAYRYAEQFYPDEAKPALAAEFRGQDKALRATGEFPTQKAGVLPKGMVDPRYLDSTAPWARKLVDQLNPEGVANRILTRAEGVSKALTVKGKARELSILVEATRNQLAHDPAVTTSVEGARYLVDNFGIKAEDANVVVHDVLKDRITGREPIFQDMVRKDPTLGPYLEDAGWVPEFKKLPEDVQAAMAPEQAAEFSAIMDDAHAKWETTLGQRVEVLKQSRPGLKGLEDIGRQEVAPTKTQIRQQKQINALVDEANKLRAKAVKAEKEAVEKQIAGHEADVQRRASAIQADIQRGQGAAERLYNERVWKAKGFKGKKWLEKTIPAIISTTIETGGATWNPFDDNFITPRWADERTTPLPPGVREIDGEGYAVSIFPRTPGPNGEPAMSTFEIPVAQMGELMPGLLDRMRGFAPLYENPDFSIGTWIDGDTVHIDLSQTTIDGKPITRDQAMLLGTARNQLSVTDLESGEPNFPGAPGSVRIARQMLNSGDDLKYRSAVARRLYEGAAKTMSAEWNGQTIEGPMYPWITAEDVDAAMAAYDYQAWTAHRANPEKYPTPASVYKDMEFRFAVDSRRANPNALHQTYLGATVGMELWKNATAAVKDWEANVAPWYQKSHDFIQKHFAGKEVTLLDGSKRPADEVFTDMLAILSVSADPKANLKYALTSFDNLEDFHKANDYNVARAQKAVEEMMAFDPKKREGTSIFKELTRDTHLYPSPKKPLMELLMGTPLDDMTPDYFAEVPQELWGAGAKSVTKKMTAAADAAGGMDTPEGMQAAMEEGGSRFYAKIKSFKDNLADPANSTSVTLDSWMARLFGEKDWMAAGAYRDYADQLRNLAAEISQREGRTVKPHEVQAVLWGYAKQEIGRLDAGVFRAQVNSVIRAIEDGNWHPENDGILDGLAVDQAQLDRAMARRDTNRSRIERRNQLVEEKLGGVKDWSKHVPAKVKKEIMAQVDAEIPEQPGAWHPETEKVAVERTTAITRPLDAGGEKESQAAYIQRNLDAYMEVADEARRLYDAGDAEGAKHVISAWSAKRLAKMEASANEFGDFQDAITGAPEGLADAMQRHGMQPGELLQMYNRDVKGTFLLNEDGKRLVHFFQTADPTTLVHEGAHALRTLMGEEDLHALEMNLGFKPGEGWSRGREEQFANMLTAWMATGSAPGSLQPLMQRLKATLAEGYTEFNRRFNSERINPETDQMFRELFSDATVPDITKEVQLLGKRKNIPIDPETGSPLLGMPEAKGGPGAVGTAPDLTGVSAPDAYRTGVRAQRIKNEMARSDARIRENLQGIARANKAREGLIKQIEDEMLPGQKAARKLEKRARGRQATLDRALETAPSRQWPREFRPMGEAFDSLAKDAATNPELASALEDVATNFPAVLKRMKELGGDPTHIRDFTEAEVKKLMYDTIRLGDVGKLGKETAAGTRKAWTGALVREGKNARSIEALAAAVVEVHHELRTNQLVDFIEEGIAVPWEGGQKLPANYVEWDPIRNRMTGQEGEATAKGNRYIVPKQVDTVLKRMNQDFNHGIFRGLSKITNPWRGMILTLSPRWYVNNFAGNLVLATLEGVKLQDWKQAWESFKNKDAGGRYADVPAVSGHAFVSDVGERNMVPTHGVKEAWDTGDGAMNKIGRARRQVGHNMRRLNEVVDEFARSAVYHRTKRIGGTEVEALVRAQKALIDYGDMSPFEQQVVRSVIPFYAWQKGILKVVARMPIDHPVAAGVMLRLGAMQNEVNADRFGGELPIGYAGLIDVTGSGSGQGGAINTRGFNPFGDSLSLTTPEGIAGSINPFADIAIRKALGAPDGGFVEQRTLSSYGTAVPDIPMGRALGDIVTGVPAYQFGASAAGAGDKGIGQQSLKTLGLNYLTADDIKKIVDRTRAAKAQIAANAPFPAKKKKASLPGSLTGRIL